MRDPKKVEEIELKIESVIVELCDYYARGERVIICDGLITKIKTDDPRVRRLANLILSLDKYR